MKKIFTFLLCGALFCSTGNAQLILNEIYTDPGSGKHEFFELYNPSLIAEQADNYTLIAYFKISGKRGFYVLDFPTFSVASKGFIVGSSASPFNFQGINNTTNTSFNWNNGLFLSANNGKLGRWEYNDGINLNMLDGNVNYDYYAETDLNDFFVRLSGSGASFVMILYKNGMPVNSAIFGSGGSITIPTELLAMPSFFVDMAGSAPDFTIDFSTYGTLAVENVNQDAGSDNGFIRKTNGTCGSWTKSSSQTMHTPLANNGGEPVGALGGIETSATIKFGDPVAGSKLTYSISSAPASQLPAIVSIYVDNGAVPGQLDIDDKFLVTNTISSVGTPYTLNFTPFDKSIIILTRSAAGCIDNMMLVSNIIFISLPVNFLNFSLHQNQAGLNFSWGVSNNENVQKFELQSSSDANTFRTVKTISTTSSTAAAWYATSLTDPSSFKTYYRIQCVDKRGSISYSPVQKIAAQSDSKTNLAVFNKGSSHLELSYEASADAVSDVRIYDMSGTEVYHAKNQFKKGANKTVLYSATTMKLGIYVLEVSNSKERITAKFYKS